MCGLEALSLHGGIGDEAEVHFVACGDQLLRDLAAAQSTQNGRLVAVSVEGLQVVVRAFLVLLDLKLVEGLEKQAGKERPRKLELSSAAASSANLKRKR